jgi:hypothetical protein
LHNDEAFLQSQGTDEIEEETFPAAETAHNNAKSRTALLNAFKVLKQRRHFVFAPNLKQVEAEAWDKSGLERLKDGVPLAALDFSHKSLG